MWTSGLKCWADYFALLNDDLNLSTEQFLSILLLVFGEWPQSVLQQLQVLWRNNCVLDLFKWFHLYSKKKSATQHGIAESIHVMYQYTEI